MSPVDQIDASKFLIDPRLAIAPQVYAWLRLAIVSLKLSPKQALSEKDLSVALGISRTPVREALIKLADEGLVDVLPQRGTFVAPIRMAEVMEAQFIRESLEVSVAAKVAGKADATIISELNDNLAKQHRALLRGDLHEFLAEDENFHMLLSASVNLLRAWKVIQNVKGQLDRVRVLGLPEPGHMELLYQQHAAIVAAITENDVASTRRHMKSHLRQVFGTIDVLIARQPQVFD